MTDRRDPAIDPRAAFVVETRVKPDGRRIHYYEWPDSPPKPAKDEPDRAAGPDRRRV